jgi:hypothetical protein
VVLESTAPDETGITAYFLKSFGVKKLAVTSNKFTTDFVGKLNHVVLEVDVYKEHTFPAWMFKHHRRAWTVLIPLK